MLLKATEQSSTGLNTKFVNVKVEEVSRLNMQSSRLIMVIRITVAINLWEMQMGRCIFVQKLTVKEIIILNNGGIVDAY